MKRLFFSLLIVTILIGLAYIAIRIGNKPFVQTKTSGDYTISIITPKNSPNHPLQTDETIPLTVELSFPADAEFSKLEPDLTSLPAFDCDDGEKRENPTVDNGFKTLRLHYDLIPVQPTYEIPDIIASFQNADGTPVTVETEPFPLYISEAGLEDELEDSYLEPVDPPGWDRAQILKLLAWCVGGLLIVVLIGGSIWRTLRQRRQAAHPVLSPYEIAQRDLNALLAERLPEAGEYKRFYQRISSILRDYLENRFDVRAPRLTTEEFLRLLTSTPELVREHQDLLRKFLSACDMVKFAAQVPESPEIAEITTACRTFLDTTHAEPPQEATSQDLPHGK